MKFYVIAFGIQMALAAWYVYFFSRKPALECIWVDKTMICQHDAILQEIERSFIKPTCPKFGGYCI